MKIKDIHPYNDSFWLFTQSEKEGSLSRWLNDIMKSIPLNNFVILSFRKDLLKQYFCKEDTIQLNINYAEKKHN